QQRCQSCAGDGRVPRPPVGCPDCGGAGARRWMRGHMVFTRTCEACEGTGHLTVQPCRACLGVGTQPRSEVVTVTVPAGVESGSRVAVPGRGHAGARGGPAGDFYVTVAAGSPPPFFRSAPRLMFSVPL